MKMVFKKLLPHLFSILALFLFSCAVFYPQIKVQLFEKDHFFKLDLKAKQVASSDHVSTTANTIHIADYKEKSGKNSYWNSAQFAGGPISLLHLGTKNNFLGLIHKALTFDYTMAIGMFFALGCAMYLSLTLLRINNWLALVLSMAYMLNLIFFTLFDAGHAQKVYTLTYLPLILSGLILILRNEKIRGVAPLVIGTSLAIYTGHIQMVYYTLIALLAFGIPLLIFAIKDNKLNEFMPNLGIAIVIAGLGALTNFAQLYSSQEFSKQTMRGGGILQKAEDPNSKDVSGLSWEYAMNWSYEVKDFFNILVPRMVGGGSSEFVRKTLPAAQLMLQQPQPPKTNSKGDVAIPGYWSSMPFTSGGAYLGASMLFLFVFALTLVKRDLAIAFGAAFFMIFLLSLGEHAEWFNRLLFNYAPLFNKFRAPSSAISITPAFITIAVALGIREFIVQKEDNLVLKKLLISFGIIGGTLGFIYLFGSSMFSFLSPNEVGYDYSVQEILIKTRKSLQKEDAFRGLVFVVLVAGLFLAYLKNFVKTKYTLFAVLAGFVMCDLMLIDRRLVTNDKFINMSIFENQFAPRASDLAINQMEPNGRGFYRVLDISSNTFNDAIPTAFHNQIGGYSPTKLQRYQDMIDYHLSKNIQNLGSILNANPSNDMLQASLKDQKVLNMLNMKYLVYNSGANPIVNNNAYGNAWFVKDLQYVASDLEEIMGINQIDPSQTAIIKSDEFGTDVKIGNGNGNILLKEYEPNRMVYQSSSNSNQLAVFSEVWYGGNPGWKVFIDGEETSMLRANYILRAMEIPSGKHEIVMEFYPQPKGAAISSISSIFAWIIIIYSTLSLLGLVNIRKSEEEAV